MVASVLSYMGDLQLRAFISFMRNQIEWHLAMQLAEVNEERMTLWVRAEPGMVYELRREFKLFLSTPEIKEQYVVYRKRIVKICLNFHVHMKSQVLARCLKRTKACSTELQEGDPFEYRNLWLLLHGCLSMLGSCKHWGRSGLGSNLNFL